MLTTNDEAAAYAIEVREGQCRALFLDRGGGGGGGGADSSSSISDFDSDSDSDSGVPNPYFTDEQIAELKSLSWKLDYDAREFINSDSFQDKKKSLHGMAGALLVSFFPSSYLDARDVEGRGWDRHAGGEHAYVKSLLTAFASSLGMKVGRKCPPSLIADFAIYFHSGDYESWEINVTP